MRPRRHLVLFLKKPALGRVKTRLARGIGPVRATAFYRRTAARLVRTLGADPRWRTWIAVSPDIAGWPAPGVTVIPQGPGDLGHRMQRVLDDLPPGPAVIVGGDIPAVTPAHVARAFKALGHAPAVLGPASDGGYWLVGLKRVPRVPRAFAGVRWSGPHALADTLCNLPGAVLVDTLDDVDVAEDWRRLPPCLR